MFWRLKSKVILLIILETIDFIVKSIFIVGVCKIGGYVLNCLCFILIYRNNIERRRKAGQEPGMACRLGNRSEQI